MMDGHIKSIGENGKKAAANIAYAKAGEAAFKLQELQYTQKQFEASDGSLPAVARAAFRQK